MTRSVQYARIHLHFVLHVNLHINFWVLLASNHALSRHTTYTIQFVCHANLPACFVNLKLNVLHAHEDTYLTQVAYLSVLHNIIRILVIVDVICVKIIVRLVCLCLFVDHVSRGLTYITLCVLCNVP